VIAEKYRSQQGLRKVILRLEFVAFSSPGWSLKIMDTGNFASLTGSASDSLLFMRMRGRESLGRPFEYELDLLSEDPALDLSSFLGQPMTVRLELPAGDSRYFNGIVTRFKLQGGIGKYARYHAVLHPWLSLLQRTADSRIFQSLSVPDIVKQIFNDLGFSDFELRLEGNYKPWDYLVQFRETDFNFVSRLLEHEGIYYYFHHEDGKHTLVLADGNGSHNAFPGHDTVTYYPVGAQVREDEHIDTWSVSKQIVSGAYAATDFNFETPKANLLETRTNPMGNASDNLEVYDYPGIYLNRGDGTQQVRVRLEEQQAAWEEAEGAGTARVLASGFLSTLEGHPREDQNREYLVVSARYDFQTNSYESGSGASARFRCAFSSMDSKIQFRTPANTRKPRVEGPQTATVVGPHGEEIWTDRYGRVKLQFHWDRYGKSDEKSSCWVRVSQLWAGSNWGAIHIPRIGQEVIVDFLEGDPDRPIITGRVYNAVNMPPYSLPAHATQSGIKSRSSKGGVAPNANELRFEDMKGSEEVYLQAEKDMNSLVKNNETAKVGVDRTRKVGHDETISVDHDRQVTVSNNETIEIGANETRSVGKNESIAVTGNESMTVGGDQDVTVSGNDSMSVGGSQSLSVGGARSESVGAAESIAVGGARSVTVGAAQALNVGGNLSESIGGSVSTDIGGKRSETVASDETISISGGQTISVGKKGQLTVKQQLIIDAGDEVVIKAGDASITLKKNGDIVLKGKNLTTDASGKVSVKAASDLVLKGSKISQN
jgi:type VI secretion system secreted protein VgrG